MTDTATLVDLLVAWKVTKDEDDEVTLEWPGFTAIWETWPLDEIEGLTVGEVEAYVARSRAVTACAFTFVMSLPDDERPYRGRVTVDLESENPSLSAPVSLKAFRACVHRAVELIDSRSVEPDRPLLEDVIEAREYDRQVREVGDRVARLVDLPDLKRWVWRNLSSFGYEQRIGWLDRFEAEVMAAKAKVAAGAPEDDGPMLTEAQEWNAAQATAEEEQRQAYLRRTYPQAYPEGEAS